MKITDLAVLVKCDDGNVYEALLGSHGTNVVKNTLEHLFPVLEVSAPLNSITIEELQHNDILRED